MSNMNDWMAKQNFPASMISQLMLKSNAPMRAEGGGRL